MSDSSLLLVFLSVIALIILIVFATKKIFIIKLNEKAEEQFKKGLEEEKLGNFDFAIEIYKNINKLSRLGLLSKLREDICKIKGSVEFDYNFEDLNKYKNFEQALDLYFRLAIKFSKQGNYEESRKIINQYLDKNDNEIKKLISYNDSKGYVDLKSDLNTINQLVNKLASGIIEIDLAIEEIYKKLQYIKSNYKGIPKDLVDDLNRIESSLINRLTLTRQNSEQYENLVDIYAKSEKYLKDYEFVKNAAIFSYNILEKGLINLNNSKYYFDLLIIAIYNPITILKTLEYTEWDDDYNFSLYDVLGFVPKTFTLPVNVKWENTTNNEILIRDLQNTLIADLQQIIHQNPTYKKITNELSEIFNKQLNQFKLIQKSIPHDYNNTTLSFDLIKQFNLEESYIPFFVKQFNKQKDESYLDLAIELSPKSKYTEIINYINFKNTWRTLNTIFYANLKNDEILNNLKKILNLKDVYPKCYTLAKIEFNEIVEKKLDSNYCFEIDIRLVLTLLPYLRFDLPVFHKLIHKTILLYNDKVINNLNALDIFTQLHNYNNEYEYLLKNLVIIIQNNFYDLTANSYTESKIIPYYTTISKKLSYQFFYFNKPLNDLYNELNSKLIPVQFNYNINYELLKKHLSIIKMFTSYGKSLSFFEY